MLIVHFDILHSVWQLALSQSRILPEYHMHVVYEPRLTVSNAYRGPRGRSCYCTTIIKRFWWFHRLMLLKHHHYQAFLVISSTNVIKAWWVECSIRKPNWYLSNMLCFVMNPVCDYMLVFHISCYKSCKHILFYNFWMSIPWLETWDDLCQFHLDDPIPEGFIYWECYVVNVFMNELLWNV